MDVKPKPDKHRVTFKDIAQELGVAVSTVSNAYNRPKQLSPALRERVFETAKQLGYSGPNPAARGLRRGETGVLGVVYSFELSYVFTDPVAALFIRGVAQEAERAGLSLLLIGGYSVNTDHGMHTTPAGRANVDGFLVHAFTDGDPLVEAVLERNLPTVLVDNPEVEGLPYVAVADEVGAREAAAHLLALGHRRLGVVALELDRDSRGGIIGPERQARAGYRTTRARLRGYRTAVEAAGLSWVDAVTVYESFDNTPEEGKKAAAALLGQPSAPTAILTMSDQLALGVLEYAREQDVRVPGELSVVGFDDALPGESGAFLTTVQQPHVEKGRQAARLLLARLRGEDAESITLVAQLVVRRSTGKAMP